MVAMSFVSVVQLHDIMEHSLPVDLFSHLYMVHSLSALRESRFKKSACAVL